MCLCKRGGGGVVHKTFILYSQFNEYFNDGFHCDVIVSIGWSVFV